MVCCCYDSHEVQALVVFLEDDDEPCLVKKFTLEAELERNTEFSLPAEFLCQC